MARLSLILVVLALVTCTEAARLRKPEEKAQKKSGLKPKEQPHMISMEFGPFESKEDACDACFNGFTKKQVVTMCQCYAYDGDSGPTSFCTMSPHAAEWINEKDGGCMCHSGEKAEDGSRFGTTCKPF